MLDKLGKSNRAIFTIGHSNHSIETFLDLVEQHGIEIIADVRSGPYSGYALHFNKEALQRALQARGIRYLFLGDVLGGRPEGEEFYDDDEHVLYDRLAQSPGFQQGITGLLDGIRTRRVALLCGEEDPTHCHRRLLIGRVLCHEGVRVVHIRGDARVQTEEELAKEEEYQKTKGQMSLFDMQETEPWRSTRSVSRKRPQPSSSGFSGEPESSG